MKVKQVMTDKVIHIGQEEAVSVAARTLAQYNIGALPVCDSGGMLRGVITDRDIVTRCLAADRQPERTSVGQIMTAQVVCADPEMEVGVAAHLMGRQQVRRLPVVRKGQLCGMLSLGDIAGNDRCAYDAADALADITSNISER